MKNNDFAMLVVAILFIALASSGMNMITGSSSVTTEAGSVIEIPWSYVYDNDYFFGSSTSARVLLDGVGTPEEVVWSQTVYADQTYSGSFNYRVPDAEGTYTIQVRSEDWSGDHWVSTGQFTVTIVVILPEYEEPDIPADDPPAVEDSPAEDEYLGSGVVPDDTPTDQTVEAVILGDSLTDKISMLWDLIKTFFENLFGGTR